MERTEEVERGAEEKIDVPEYKGMRRMNSSMMVRILRGNSMMQLLCGCIVFHRLIKCCFLAE